MEDRVSYYEREDVTVGHAIIGADSVVKRDIPSHAMACRNAKVRGFTCKFGRRPIEEEKKRGFVLMKYALCGEKYKMTPENYAKVLESKE